MFRILASGSRGGPKRSVITSTYVVPRARRCILRYFLLIGLHLGWPNRLRPEPAEKAAAEEEVSAVAAPSSCSASQLSRENEQQHGRSKGS